MPGDDTRSEGVRGESGAGWILGGRYRLIDELGAGGMATVFLAEDDVLGRRVAVKLLRRQSSGADLRRFAREAKLGAALNHPNIVSVYDILTESDHVVIVMEYVRGVDLSAALRGGALEEGEALGVLSAVAAALDHAHGRGIVHRDVKPSNVLLGDDGAVKLADLGIAKALEDTGTTEAGRVPGTPLYMAPELLAGRRVTAAADVCSFALVAYEVLSGRRPRSGRTVPEVAHQIATQPPPDLREARSNTPPAAAELLSRAMDPDPARRPATAGGLVEALGAALAGGGTRAEEAPPAARAPKAEPAEAWPPTEPFATPPLSVPSPAEPEAEQAASTPTPAPREWAPSPAPRQRARRARWAIPALLAVVLALVVAIVALFVGGDSEEAPSSPEANSGGSASAEKHRPERRSAAAAERTVRGFYERAAAGDYGGAEALATPGLLGQIGGFDQFDTLESIHFDRLEGSVSGDRAEVSLSTVATHTDRVDNCSGSAGLVLERRWLLDVLAINCR